MSRAAIRVSGALWVYVDTAHGGNVHLAYREAPRPGDEGFLIQAADLGSLVDKLEAIYEEQHGPRPAELADPEPTHVGPAPELPAPPRPLDDAELLELTGVVAHAADRVHTLRMRTAPGALPSGLELGAIGATLRRALVLLGVVEQQEVSRGGN